MKKEVENSVCKMQLRGGDLNNTSSLRLSNQKTNTKQVTDVTSFCETKTTCSTGGSK